MNVPHSLSKTMIFLYHSSIRRLLTILFLNQRHIQIGHIMVHLIMNAHTAMLCSGTLKESSRLHDGRATKLCTINAVVQAKFAYLPLILSQNLYLHLQLSMADQYPINLCGTLGSTTVFLLLLQWEPI